MFPHIYQQNYQRIIFVDHHNKIHIYEAKNQRTKVEDN